MFFQHSLRVCCSNLQAQCDVPIPIIVVSLEDIRHALQTNARLHKQVETESILPRPLIAARPRILRVRIEQQLHKRGTQAVSKRHQRIRELEVRNTPAPVLVKAVEEAAPGCQEPPKAAEFFKVYGATAVCIEHADHHLDGVRVEGCVVAVDKGAAEFGFGELAAAVFVDLHEEGPEAVAVVLVAGRRAYGGRALLLGDWCAAVRARGRRALTVVGGRRRRGEGRALLLLGRRRLGVLLLLLLRRVVESRGWRLRVGVVGCVVAGLLVPVLRWWRRRTRGAV
jgi:hypothetical protein